MGLSNTSTFPVSSSSVRIKSESGSVTATPPIYLHHFRLDWEAVDDFKRRSYVKWVEEHWKEKFPKALEGRFPATLPDRYNAIIMGLTFALPKDYQAEIEHFAQLYFLERHRVRHFDTCIREMCLQVSQAAINCAFRLLADCIYDQGRQGWFRENAEVDKRLCQHLMMYKFWREATGRGLVQDHAEFWRLRESIALLQEKCGNKGSTRGGTRPWDDVQRLSCYQRCLAEIDRWEEDQEKFRDFITIPVDRPTAGWEPAVGGEIATEELTDR